MHGRIFSVGGGLRNAVGQQHLALSNEFWAGNVQTENVRTDRMEAHMPPYHYGKHGKDLGVRSLEEYESLIRSHLGNVLNESAISISPKNKCAELVVWSSRVRTVNKRKELFDVLVINLDRKHIVSFYPAEHPDAFIGCCAASAKQISAAHSGCLPLVQHQYPPDLDVSHRKS